jgi:hypothetical protein
VGEGRRSKPAVVSVKREVVERVANMRFAGPQAYFIRFGLSWASAAGGTANAVNK